MTRPPHYEADGVTCGRVLPHGVGAAHGRASSATRSTPSCAQHLKPPEGVSEWPAFTGPGLAREVEVFVCHGLFPSRFQIDRGSETRVPFHDEEVPSLQGFFEWAVPGSNQRPPACKNVVVKTMGKPAKGLVELNPGTGGLSMEGARYRRITVDPGRFGHSERPSAQSIQKPLKRHTGYMRGVVQLDALQAAQLAGVRTYVVEPAAQIDRVPALGDCLDATVRFPSRRRRPHRPAKPGTSSR